MIQNNFCTCTESGCKFHPSNNDGRCNSCIEENLKTDEIPNCFFHKIGVDTDADGDYTFLRFAGEMMSKHIDD